MQLTLNQFEVLVLIERTKEKLSQRDVAKEINLSLSLPPIETFT